MLDNIPEKYEIDPGTDIGRLADIFIEQYPDAVRHTVEEAIFVDDGPIGHLTWVALDDYSQHEFFYHDPEPDKDVIRCLLSMSPTEREMKLLRAFLSKQFDVMESIPHIEFLTVPDTYLPGSEPRANVAFYQNPVGEQIHVGLNATPLSHEQEILEHADRLIPARDLETFARNVITEFYDELEAIAADHLIEGDVRSLLEADADFRYQTTKPLPDGIHPTYTGEEAELWQKPISQEPAIDGSHGFVQVWIPKDESAGFVFLTDGDYEQDSALESVRTALEYQLQ